MSFARINTIKEMLACASQDFVESTSGEKQIEILDTLYDTIQKAILEHVPFDDLIQPILEQKCFADKNKVLLSGYPLTILHSHLYGFYEDRLTQQAGVIRIPL